MPRLAAGLSDGATLIWEVGDAVPVRVIAVEKEPIPVIGTAWAPSSSGSPGKNMIAVAGVNATLRARFPLAYFSQFPRDATFD